MSATIKLILANAYVIQKMSTLFDQSQIKVVAIYLKNNMYTLYYSSFIIRLVAIGLSLLSATLVSQSSLVILLYFFNFVMQTSFALLPHNALCSNFRKIARVMVFG